MDAIECIKNPNTCVAHWVYHPHTLYPPEQIAFKCYNASQKMIKVSTKFIFLLFDFAVGYFTICFVFFLIGLQKNNESYQSNPSLRIGQNKFAKMTVDFAKKCGFYDLKSHKSHSKRAFGITLLQTLPSQSRESWRPHIIWTWNLTSVTNVILMRTWRKSTRL